MQFNCVLIDCSVCFQVSHISSHSMYKITRSIDYVVAVVVQMVAKDLLEIV